MLILGGGRDANLAEVSSEDWTGGLPPENSCTAALVIGPPGRLTEAHRDRLLVEDRLREALIEQGFVLDAEQLRTAAGKRPAGS
jgi:hypothetical protein